MQYTVCLLRRRMRRQVVIVIVKRIHIQMLFDPRSQTLTQNKSGQRPPRELGCGSCSSTEGERMGMEKE